MSLNVNPASTAGLSRTQTMLNSAGLKLVTGDTGAPTAQAPVTDSATAFLSNRSGLPSRTEGAGRIDLPEAKAAVTLTGSELLRQSGTAILAQANSLPNGVLALLRG